jgi:hypothetical protein
MSAGSPIFWIQAIEALLAPGSASATMTEPLATYCRWIISRAVTARPRTVANTAANR